MSNLEIRHLIPSGLKKKDEMRHFIPSGVKIGSQRVEISGNPSELYSLTVESHFILKCSNLCEGSV